MNNQSQGKMISASEITAIKKEKFFFDQLRVDRVGQDIFKIVGFNYGEEESKLTGYADEVAKYLNGYFGISE